MGSITGLGRSRMPQSNWAPVPKLLRNSSRFCALEPEKHNYWAPVLQLLKPVSLEPVLCNREANARRRPCTTPKNGPCSLQLEKSLPSNENPIAKIYKIINNITRHFVKRRRHSFLWMNSSFLITGTLNLIKFESESRSAVPDSLQPDGLYILAWILQARILKWVAFPFPKGSSQPRD